MPDTYTQLRYHVVFGTKHRVPSIPVDLQDELYAYFGGLLAEQGGILLAAGGMPDHVHLLIGLRDTHSVAEVMQRLKASSSRWMKDRSERNGYFSWQAGYGAFSVSKSKVPAVRAYLARQEAHHRKLTFGEELEELLRKHGVEVDPRFPPASS